ncbi:ABC transporter, putative [Bodo saltans]|uniref:ABC transporter, putative n=1 Tax=Bodo saltans TaxID=75058 RepID=A0A0S4JAA4_BODSA|nr:ABC transporter, putative [Bodo saltans]|eukprot:CUG87056.1 ABC transporter, putative [Bodo saltans]
MNNNNNNNNNNKHDIQSSEEDSAMILSKLLFVWVTPLLRRGMERKKEKEQREEEQQRVAAELTLLQNTINSGTTTTTDLKTTPIITGNPLTSADLLHLPESEDPTAVYRLFRKAWANELRRVGADLLPSEGGTSSRRGSVDSVTGKKEAATTTTGEDPSLLRALLNANRRDLLLSGFLRLLSLVSLAMPFFLKFFVQWMNDFSDPTRISDPVPTYMGFIWALAIPLAALSSNMLLTQHSHYSLRAHLRMRGACALAIFDKALVLWPHHGLGGLVTQMHSSDTFKFFEMFQYFHWLWIAPLQIIISLVCLYIFIGWAGVISIGVMAIALPLQSMALKQVAEAQKSVSKCADARQGLLREVVRGIRIIKFMGLEAKMTDRMQDTRSIEEKNYDRVYFWKSVVEILGTFSPVLVTFVVFIAAWLLGDPVNSESLFSTMVMLQLLRTPVMAVSAALAKYDELRVSVKRIQDFLLFDERSPVAPPGSPADFTPPSATDDGPSPRPTTAEVNVPASAFPASPSDRVMNPLAGVAKLQSESTTTPPAGGGEQNDEVMAFTNDDDEDDAKKHDGNPFTSPASFPLHATTPNALIANASAAGMSVESSSVIPNARSPSTTFVGANSSVGLSLATPPVGAMRAGAKAPKNAITMSNVSIMKESGDQIVPVMQDINLDFPRGSLTVIYGPTGSGKSLILRAILKEVLLHPNSSVVVEDDAEGDRDEVLPVDAFGSSIATSPAIIRGGPKRSLIAYASQDAYLRRGTVRDNVTFGAPFDQERFDHVAQCSQMISDLKIMDKGDQTLLTDRGANLSGGQRQRIAVARAAYADSSIVLLDDPLSALDPLVGRKLAHECIGGWMSKRTRVLVTNQVDMILLADRVIITKDLRVAFTGSWKELKESAAEDVRSIFPADARVTLFGETKMSKKFVAAAVTTRIAGGGLAGLVRGAKQQNSAADQQAADELDVAEVTTTDIGGSDEPGSPSPQRAASVVSTASSTGARKPSLKRFVSSFKFRIATKFTAMARKKSNLDVFRATSEMSEKDKAALNSALNELFNKKSDTVAVGGDDGGGLGVADIPEEGTQVAVPHKHYMKRRKHKHHNENLTTSIEIAVGPSAHAAGSIDDDDEYEEEDEEEPPGPLKWHVQNQSWINFTVTLIFCVAQRVVNIIADLIVSNWAGRKAVFGYQPDDTGYATWYGVAVAILFVCLVGYDMSYYVFGASHAVRRTHSAMFHRLLFAPTSFFDANTLGNIVSRFSRDLDCVDRSFIERLNALLYSSAIVVGSCILMCYAAPYLAAVLVAAAFAYGVVLRYFNATAVNLRAFEASCRTPMISLIGEALGGLDVIRSYGVSDEFRNEHIRAYQASAHALYNVGSLQLWFNQQLGVLNALIIVFMTFMVTGLMVSYDVETRNSQQSVLALAVTYTVSLSLGFLMNLFIELQTFYGSVERASEYATSIEQEAGAPKNVKELQDSANITTSTTTTATTVVSDDWPSQGAVQFEDVCLRYRPDLPRALDGLTVAMNPGEHIGVVGRTGSGKSTLIQALFRLVELDGGFVVVDGVETSGVALGRLRNGMTIVPQDPMLFQGTIRANIDPLGLYSDDACEKALQRVGLTEGTNFTLSSEIEESGGNLSTGQRQLLCLARAMVRNRPILVMDEATANVDGVTDERMQEIVRTDFSKLTTITIAHRLDTIIDSDKILVMDKGRMVEFDTPKALLGNHSSVFYSIASGLGEEQLNGLIARVQ